jgi:hypothetical protein
MPEQRTVTVARYPVGPLCPDASEGTTSRPDGPPSAR